MKYLIIDDHAILRDGIAVLLRQADRDAIVLEASDGAQGLTMTRDNPDLDLVLLDLEMPGLSGRPALEEFGKHHPHLPVVILSSSEDERDVRLALASGALGYVPKSASAKTLLAALQLVLRGEVYVPPLLLGLASPRSGDGEESVRAEHLTERQMDVLRLIERGKSNKEISSELGLSEKTVKVHVTAIFRALNVENRGQAARAVRRGGVKLKGEGRE
jgi:two-component system, NarL family, nitrate/nitrite response regulator NarL